LAGNVSSNELLRLITGLDSLPFLAQNSKE
jgi:hypothetical protein